MVSLSKTRAVRAETRSPEPAPKIAPTQQPATQTPSRRTASSNEKDSRSLTRPMSSTPHNSTRKHAPRTQCKLMRWALEEDSPTRRSTPQTFLPTRPKNSSQTRDAQKSRFELQKTCPHKTPCQLEWTPPFRQQKKKYQFIDQS
jgi:hypothetical protein